ncbi:MAG: metallopeptidase family protein [Patescibacteria group bacterium]
MERIKQKVFKGIVETGVADIPDRFLQKLNNVSVVIEGEPAPEQIGKFNLRHGWTLFGLYEGVPQISRGSNYGLVLPDKITIFQKPIEQAARNLDDVKEIVKNTVWHEIAHHFGMNEAEVRQSESRRKSKKSRTVLE